MALSDEEIVAQNPWWVNPGWRAIDPHLVALEHQPMRLPASFLEQLDLDSAGIHVLRGPRQVGKSTGLKLLVERALDHGRPPRSVIYLALDALEGQRLTELARSVRRAKALANPDGPCLLLVDEVTALERWQTAAKLLWDEGTIRDDVVVCTGSSATDLWEGAAERLPGRRGAGEDSLALPQDFAAFARAIDGSIPTSPGLTVAQMRTGDGHAVLEEAAIHRPALNAALERYLRFGGLPAAVAEAVAGAPEPSERVKRVLHDSLVKEVQGKGASIPAAHALLVRVLRSLGSPTNWSEMAREMDVPLGRGASERPSHHTLRTYLEFLASCYFLLIAYFWHLGSATNELSKRKKLFFADPLLHTIALDRAPGLRVDVPALVENVVGMALYRRYEPAERIAETFAAPERLHIWRTRSGGEIDFVAGPRTKLDVVEVKYRSRAGRAAAAAAAKSLPGRPIVMATKDELRSADAYSLVPASLLLWALG